MSNATIIAAVTSALVTVLTTSLDSDTALNGTGVTTLPVDKARDGGNKNQLNLFLYQTVPNAAWRNMDSPTQVKPGERGNPPLALNLYYLVTAFGADNSEILGQRILGNAMGTLHSRPLLDPSEIKSAIPGVDPGDQIERVRFSPQPLSLEDMSKLWTTLQTQYRLSVAYLATVVLIDSQQPSKSALPVLTRGKSDRGVFSIASASPSITEVQPANSLPSAELGGDLVISGQNLSGGGIKARLNHPLFSAPIELAPQPTSTDASLTVHIPGTLEDAGALAKWFPGLYTLSLVVGRPPLPTWTTNEAAFGFAPAITVNPSNAPAGTINLTLTCAPRLDSLQRVLLIFGDQQVAPKTITNPADTTKPTSLTFAVSGVAKGSYPVRLRVDGVDSMPFVVSGTPPVPSFDPAQVVTAT